jgi:hypothetical protein
MSEVFQLMMPALDTLLSIHRDDIFYRWIHCSPPMSYHGSTRPHPRHMRNKLHSLNTLGWLASAMKDMALLAVDFATAAHGDMSDRDAC